MIESQIPVVDLKYMPWKDDPRKRIEQNLDPTKALEGENEMANVWADHKRSSPRPEVYEKSLTEQWRETGCAADGAPYVLRSLADRLDERFIQGSPEVPKLAAAFFDEAHCPGAYGLSEADKTKLKKIAARAAPPAPKP